MLENLLYDLRVLDASDDNWPIPKQYHRLMTTGDSVSIIQRIENLTYKIANPIVKALLRSPLHKIASGSLTLLHFTGRKSGRRFVTPLSYVRKQDTVWLLSAHSTRWWMNLRGGDAAVTLEIARTTYTGKARLWETDSTELRDRVRSYLSALPRDAKVYGIKLDDNKTPDEGSLIKASPQLVFVEIQLDSTKVELRKLK